MRSSRIAVCAAVIGALSVPLFSASSASAASTPAAVPAAVAQPCERPGPWVIGTQAVTIHSKATTKSTSLGILYKGHKFTVHKTSGNWHYITDRTTGVKGWVSGTYVYRDVRMCLD
ncbi:SH3 domain-containing protein [Streptomyces sp. NPDC102274]|uniref:SH3 domain-containing protein n=1 Tax=Streptomyces sp. NPDC102274 TaxID=3366151 RepID=UPI0037F9F999